jgi:hypothetical protein
MSKNWRETFRVGRTVWVLIGSIWHKGMVTAQTGRDVRVDYGPGAHHVNVHESVIWNGDLRVSDPALVKSRMRDAARVAAILAAEAGSVQS